MIQPGSYGDNINSTLMLSPIIAKYPDAIIDVHTSSIFGSAFDNNHLIHNLFKHSALSKQEALHLLTTIPTEIKKSNYNLILNPHPMINHDKWSCIKHQELGENLIFAWARALEDNNIEYELPFQTHLYLTEAETKKAKDWIDTLKPGPKALIETGPESGQSFFDHNWVIKITDKLASQGWHVMISNKSHDDYIKCLQNKYNWFVHFVGTFTLRECAEIFNNSDLFVSCSSGLSNICNTNYCKKNIKWVEVVNSLTCSSAAVRNNNKIFWHDNNVNNFIEATF